MRKWNAKRYTSGKGASLAADEDYLLHQHGIDPWDRALVVAVMSARDDGGALS